MEEKAIAEEVSSTQKSLSSFHDPGWNDPPKWAFSPTTNTGVTPTKRSLNKRVAFPLSREAQKKSSTDDRASLDSFVNLSPPLPTSSVLGTAARAPPSTAAEKGGFLEKNVAAFDKREAFGETMENLEAAMSEELEPSGQIDEVKKRLEVLRNMWEEDKIDDGVCEKVFKISQALRIKDVETADKIHVSLMMEHATMCNTWISCVRHIILELRGKSSREISAVASDESLPYLLPHSEEKNEDQ